MNTVLLRKMLNPHQRLAVAPRREAFTELFASVGFLSSFKMFKVFHSQNAEAAPRQLFNGPTNVIVAFLAGAAFALSAGLSAAHLLAQFLDARAIVAAVAVRQQFVVTDVDAELAAFGFDRLIGHTNPEDCFATLDDAAAEQFRSGLAEPIVQTNVRTEGQYEAFAGKNAADLENVVKTTASAFHRGRQGRELERVFQSRFAGNLTESGSRRVSAGDNF